MNQVPFFCVKYAAVYVHICCACVCVCVCVYVCVCVRYVMNEINQRRTPLSFVLSHLIKKRPLQITLFYKLITKICTPAGKSLNTLITGDVMTDAFKCPSMDQSTTISIYQIPLICYDIVLSVSFILIKHRWSA